MPSNFVCIKCGKVYPTPNGVCTNNFCECGGSKVTENLYNKLKNGTK